MSKIFDYKFLIILGLSLVVYFLYREVEFLNKRVGKLEINTPAIERPKQQIIDLPPPPSDEDNTSTCTSVSSIIENMDMEKKEISQKSSPRNSSKNHTRSSSKSIPKKSTIDNIIDKTIAETLQSNDTKLDNAIRQSTVNNNDEVNELHETVEEYSNENGIDHNIYSHDKLDSNTNEHDSLMVESIVNMVKDDEIDIVKLNEPPKQTVESLTRLKLDELQEMATKLNININTENGKKKKKADLALEILTKENLNKTL